MKGALLNIVNFFLSHSKLQARRTLSPTARVRLYPVPQNAPHISVEMNVPNLPEGKCPKATDVSLWYGVYSALLMAFWLSILGVARRNRP